jgi:hypothetical protein
MTEEEWLAWEDPWPMLDFLRGKASNRKLRLYAVACCRRLWHLVSDERSKRAVEAAEQYADGTIIRETLLAVCNSAEGVYQDANLRAEDPENAAPTRDRIDECFGYACWTCSQITHPGGYNPSDAVDVSDSLRNGLREAGIPSDSERSAQAKLSCDVFGNPFRLVTPDRSWLTPTVTSLAQAIYDDRAFDRLPILADALEDAGCTNQDILEHCRGGGEHVRGCWVVDLLLGKE